MSTIPSQSTHATLITTDAPADLSPLESLIMDLCNLLHEARADNDTPRIESLQTELDSVLDQYEQTNAEDHPNPAWAIPNQRALASSAAGDLEHAIQLEKLALMHADTPRRKEISLGNLTDRSIRLKRYNDAVEHFLRAQSIAPQSIPILVTGAQALYYAGYVTHANNIFTALLSNAQKNPDLLSPTSELASYLDFESRLNTIAPDLPALDQLLSLYRNNTNA